MVQWAEGRNIHHYHHSPPGEELGWWLFTMAKCLKDKQVLEFLLVGLCVSVAIGSFFEMTYDTCVPWLDHFNWFVDLITPTCIIMCASVAHLKLCRVRNLVLQLWETVFKTECKDQFSDKLAVFCNATMCTVYKHFVFSSCYLTEINIYYSIKSVIWMQFRWRFS